jgi:magnesium-protoporphyrin IX monomethyl ester (oxidative) cyclase
LELIRNLGNKRALTEISGLAFYHNGELICNSKKYIKNLDLLPFPARGLIPLENYWKIKKSHGPTTAKHTPIITSRGCPYNCSFCSSSLFWNRLWRARSVENVIDEIRHCIEDFGITEFEFEDDNLTLNPKRAKTIFREIINRGFKITWSAPNGLNSENLDEEMLTLMKDSGCVHIAVAPESGSQRILKDIYKKKVDLDKIKCIVRKCNKIGIKTAGFFVVGTPVETKDDRILTRRYIAELAKCGLDEVGIFPCVPYPGTEIRNLYELKNINEEIIIGDIPEWYPNYKAVDKYIKNLYLTFIINKLLYHPKKILFSIKNILTGRQELKMERVVISLLSSWRRRMIKF